VNSLNLTLSSKSLYVTQKHLATTKYSLLNEASCIGMHWQTLAVLASTPDVKGVLAKMNIQ